MARLLREVSRQHRQLLELLDTLGGARTKARRAELSSALSAMWRAHARAEERLFYLRHSMELEEHAMIEFMLERVASPAPAATTLARVRMLREMLVRHHDLEERVRIPALVRTLSPKEEARLASAMAKLAP